MRAAAATETEAKEAPKGTVSIGKLCRGHTQNDKPAVVPATVWTPISNSRWLATWHVDMQQEQGCSVSPRPIPPQARCSVASPVWVAPVPCS